MNKESIALIKRIGDGTFLVYESTEDTEFDYIVIVGFRADIEDLYHT